MNLQKTENFNEILSTIQTSKQKAYVQVNTTLVELYWSIGKHISVKVKQKSWGKGIVQELANFIKEKEPNIKGFTARNMWMMKQFYETYSDNPKLHTLCAVLSWSHNRLIMALKTHEEREFYLILCSKKKYAVRELDRLIRSGTYERVMLSDQKLSSVMEELPQDVDGVFKDSYIFEFLDLPIPHKEKDLQQALIGSLKDFILELGIGFAFMGEEYKLEVGDDTFKVDLLFYHRYLNCLVAFELKIGKFKPSHLGQLEFYLEALDKDVKTK
ncbi:MAG: PDDEXK nuclease domain-containing protein, partial [Campylobacterota bacterium]|nr:PDDEXK nuclease domain-containing protein [Campylobacterota bacterium]